MITVRAPCIEQSTPLWFWELWAVGPFVLTDTAWVEIYEAGDGR